MSSLPPLSLYLDVNPAIAGLLPGPAWGEAATWQAWLRCWLAEQICLLSVVGGCELSLQLSDDAALKDLNTRYRHVEAPTDVLSFAALDSTASLPAEVLACEPFYLGDLAISVETATRQASARQHDLTSELVWLAAHGLLHLLGWDHPDRDSLQAMLHSQERLLRASAHLPPDWQEELSVY